MEFQLPIHIATLPDPISYSNKILLMGSCFTEHIGNRLHDLKFNVLQNPNGILFDPQSVSSALISYINNKSINEDDLFYLDELWQSWQHHSVFSNIDRKAAIENINNARNNAHVFLKEANWVIITLGSAFQYRLTDNDDAVANCHRAPANRFRKHLMGIEEINSHLDSCIHQLLHFNPKLRFLFTVSPVRHVRDGVVENNRSKARLIEVVHHLVGKFDRLYYFPSYELVIDVLRDYRFFDVDMVHPNYPATGYVLEKFMEHCVDVDSRAIMDEIVKVVMARKHRALQPATIAHKKFLLTHAEKAKNLSERFPFLNLTEEIKYFQEQAANPL
ncbi:MAG: GSCFA domain-containing protein [Gemmatimonadaceae bacterium]|nr:GSCFA domain-containing protein [Chitinophagaceae bacterium]